MRLLSPLKYSLLGCLISLLLPAFLAAAPTKEQQGAVDALRKAGFLAQQVAINNEHFDVNFKLAGKPVTDQHLKQLGTLGGLVHSLNLAGTDVKDGKLGVLGKLKNLKRLHLENTAVSDAGLDHVKGLAGLEYLNLYGTKVGDDGLKKLAGLKNLKKLYLWQSAATEDGAKALFAKLPETFINLGSDKPVIGPKVVYERPPEVVEKPTGPTEVPEKVSYKEHIMPMFKKSCYSCHGEEKQKGKLRLDTPEFITKSETIVNGMYEDSEVHVRVTLPKDDDDFMPPEGKGDPFTDVQIAILEKWIKDGAKFD